MESAYHLPCQDRIRKVPGHRIQVSRRFAHQVTALTQPYDPTEAATREVGRRRQAAASVFRKNPSTPIRICDYHFPPWNTRPPGWSTASSTSAPPSLQWS